MHFAFSDGNPVWEYGIFLATLLAATAFFLVPGALARFEGALAKIARFTRRRQALPEHGLLADLRRVDLFRIMVGAMATWRYGKMFSVALAGGDAATSVLAGVAMLLAAFVAVGFLTPASVLLLMSAGNLLFDNYLGASTLGTMVMSICLLVLLLAPAGLTLSVDALLEGRGPFAGAVGFLRRTSGAPNADRLLLAKLSGLFAYFCVCLYSVSWHANDEAWTSGLVIAWVMLSPVANPDLSDRMWDAYNLAPMLFVGFARLSMAGMFVWYVLTLPGLYLGRWIRRFTVIWGLLFFLISAFLLPLQFLGWYELAFWFVLFAQGKAFGAASGPALAVLFDDRCNLCDRTVKVLARLDIFGRLEFRPIRRNLAFATQHGVTLEEGLTDLVGVDLATGGRVSGFQLYYQLTAHLFLLWPLRPVLWLGRVTGAGPAVYRYVADRRTKLFGVCEFSNIPDRYLRQGGLPGGTQDARATPFTAGVVLALLVLASAFLLRLPLGTITPDQRPVAATAKSLFGAAPAAFGIHRINVFNTEDLATFRFTSKLSLHQDGFDLASNDVDEDPGSETEEIGLAPIVSDKQTYLLTSQMRRMARMNFGCDRQFAAVAMPILRDFYRPPDGVVPEQDVVMEFRITAWPTADDLMAHTPLHLRDWPLCRMRMNLQDQVLREFAFVQEGLDEAVRQKGAPPILRADQAEAVLGFPCGHGAAFVQSTATPPPPGAGRDAFGKAMSRLAEDRFGRFGSDCFIEAWQLLERWPGSFPAAAQTGLDGGYCQLGVGLLTRLRDAFPTRTPAAQSIDDQLQRAERAAAQNQVAQCWDASRAGWKAYWDAVLVSPLPALQAWR